MAWLTWVPCYCLEVVHAYRSSAGASVSYHAYIKYIVMFYQYNCNPVNTVDNLYWKKLYLFVLIVVGIFTKIIMQC